MSTNTSTQISVQQITSFAVNAMAVSILAEFMSMAIASMGAGALSPGTQATEKMVQDMRNRFGEDVVNAAIVQVGLDDIPSLGKKIEELYIARMKRDYGSWQTDIALEYSEPGDLAGANEIAKSLKERGAFKYSSKIKDAVKIGKRRGRQKAKPVKDTKTGIVYQSHARAGMAVAAEYGLDNTNHFIWYVVIEKDPDRFVDVGIDRLPNDT